MSDLHHKLKEAYAAHQKALRVDRHLQQLNDELNEAYLNLDRLRKNLEDEFKDVEVLEKLSIKGLFHSVLGSKEEQLEIERQEYLQASLKYDEARKSVQILEYERDILEKQVQDLSSIESTLKQLMAEREQQLIEAGSEQGRKILDISDQIEMLDTRMTEIKEVMRTGQEALMMLEKMIGYLRKARSWGQWDMAGRNNGMSYLKHSVLDKARDLSYHVKHFLLRFKEDLRDLHGFDGLNFTIHFESFNRFTDIFFDNLISDWIIQKKIQNALTNVQTVKDKVLRINQSLGAEIQQCELDIEALTAERKKLVING